jgi:hypothetical protein
MSRKVLSRITAVNIAVPIMILTASCDLLEEPRKIRREAINWGESANDLVIRNESYGDNRLGWIHFILDKNNHVLIFETAIQK